MVSSLIQNLALVVSLAVGLQLLARRVLHRPYVYVVVAGLLAGAAGIGGMMIPVEFAPGIIYDARVVVLALVGGFSGLVPAAIAAVMCGVYRWHLGGDGAVVGIATIILAAALGALLYHLRQRDERWEQPPWLFGYGVGVAVAMMVPQGFLPGVSFFDVLLRIGPVVITAYPLGFMVAALVYLEGERRRRAEERLELALAGADLGAWDWDFDRGTVTVNARNAELVGLPPRRQILSAQSWKDRVHPDDLEAVMSSAIDHIEGRSPRMEQLFRMRREDGHYIWALSRGAITRRDALGRPLRLSGTTLDVTEARETEAALRESTERLQAAIRAAHVGLWDWNPRTGEVFFSREWKEQLGYEDHEIPNDFEEWRKRVHPDDLEPTLEKIRGFVEGARPSYEVEFRMRHRDGSHRNLVAQASTVTDDQGRVVRVLGSHVDITASKQAEAQRESLEAQLRQSQRLESVGQLAGGVAHDFNNMLSIILGHTELAMEDVPPGSQLYRDLDEIRRAGTRSADLTRQLLAFARRQAAKPENIDLDEAVEGTLKMLRRLIGEDIELSWIPSGVPVRVEIDRSQLDQVLVNLVVNARDAIAGPGRIVISTDHVDFDDAFCAANPEAQPGPHVSLVVRDDGCGMDAATRIRVFEPFFTTKAVGQGTGLGLSTVYGIVKQNQGFVTVHSEPGRGSTFAIHLPARDPSSTPGQVLADGVPVTGRGERILVVEDEPALLEMTARQLTQLGYEVVTALTAREADATASDPNQRIDLLLTDVVMPDRNGRELYQQLRQRRPGLRCLFMSGYSADAIAERGVLSERVRYVQKPFEARILAREVRAALDAPPAPEHAPSPSARDEIIS